MYQEFLQTGRLKSALSIVMTSGVTCIQIVASSVSYGLKK